MPLISFIIPYHNEPCEMLTECIDSVARLPLHEGEAEIIVVDDGSKENLNEYLSQRYNHLVYLRQENKGLSMARNAGFEQARGEYVQFIDADDCLISENYVHAIDLIQREQADVVQFRFSLTPIPCKNIKHYHYIESGPEMIGSHNLRAAAWSYVFRKKLAGDLRFKADILHEDELFTPLLFLRAQKVVSISTQSYYYRSRQDSITSIKDEKHILCRLKDKTKILLQLDETCESLNFEQAEALQRRITQLAADIIIDTARLTHNKAQVKTITNVLHCLGLFPLPLKPYGFRYRSLAIFTHLMPYCPPMSQLLIRFVS